MRSRLSLDFAAADAAAVALNGSYDAFGAAAAAAAAAAGGYLFGGGLQFAVPRLSLWVRVCGHEAAEALSKQLNDKERIAAALCTPAIRRTVLSAMQLEE